MKKSLFKLALALMGLIFYGTFGYSVVEGWSLSDSFYMTIITITTTGYEEVHPLSDTGRGLTITLIALGIFTLAYASNLFIQEVLTVDYKSRRRKKMEKNIQKLKDHTIVCGFGRMGKVICTELQKANKSFVVLDRNSSSFKNIPKDYLYLEGDVTSDDLLKKANIHSAKNLVCMVDNDADSLYVTLAGRSLNPDLYIVSRANEEEAQSKILRAGSDRVILPIHVSGLNVAQLILKPDHSDLLKHEEYQFIEKDHMKIHEIPVSGDCHLVGKTLLSWFYKHEKVLVLGIRHFNGDFVFKPAPTYEFRKGDTLIAMSTEELKELSQEKAA